VRRGGRGDGTEVEEIEDAIGVDSENFLMAIFHAELD
jgi:hypothetical protein